MTQIMTNKKFIHDENPELKKLFTSLNLTSNLKNQILKKNLAINSIKIYIQVQKTLILILVKKIKKNYFL